MRLGHVEAGRAVSPPRRTGPANPVSPMRGSVEAEIGEVGSLAKFGKLDFAVPRLETLARHNLWERRRGRFFGFNGTENEAGQAQKSGNDQQLRRYFESRARSWSIPFGRRGAPGAIASHDHAVQRLHPVFRGKPDAVG